MRVYTENGYWDEPHLSLNLLKTNNWLAEIYSKTNLADFEDLIDTLLAFYRKEIPYKNLNDKSIKYRIGFELVSEDSKEINKLRFDPSYGITIVPIQNSQIQDLLNIPEYKRKFLKNLKSLVVHEDTHKQQFDCYRGYNKDYTFPESLDPFTDLTNQDVKYFSQTIEADAYGREVGEILKQQYKNKSANWIFENVIERNIPAEIKDFIDVYRDPRISRKGFQHFWRALYDYLMEKEEPLDERLLKINDILSDIKNKRYSF